MQEIRQYSLITKWYKKTLSLWVIQEFMIINKLAWPVVLASFGNAMLTMTCLIFTGHIGGSVYLDGTALAISFGNVTGTSIVVGVSSGMDTLCSQAYGGKNYRLVGLYFQRAGLLLLLVCFPIWALWLNAESLLILLHQDAGVAAVAGKYLRILCVAKPAVIIFTISEKFLQTQNVVNPTLFITIVGNVVNICSHYLLVVHLGFGVEGSAISLSLSYWSLAVSYLAYIRCSSLYHTSWPGWSSDALNGWIHYCKYGIPSLLMVCLEWWSFEIGYLVIGATSLHPKVEIGIYSIMFKLSDQLYSIPIGYTTAATVRVGNLLGENNPVLARRTAFLCLVMIFVIGVHFSVGVLLLRYHLPLLFTTDSCIIAGAAQTLVITAIYENADGFQLMAGGILKGCGRQGITSFTNLIIYEIISLPLAICLAVVLKLDTKGFFIGLMCGIFLQAILYIVLILCTNWKKVTEEALRNAGLSQSITENTSTNNLLPTDPLLDSNVKGVRTCRTWCQDIVKTVIILIFVGSFGIGLGLSFYRPLSTNHNNSTLFNSSSLNYTNNVLCPY